MIEKQMYEDGKTIYQIAGEVGISPTGVWKRLKKQGVQMRGGTRLGSHWAKDKRGEEFLGADGRIWVRGIQSSSRKNSQRREVVVMEQILGHSVPPGYIVHHRDENITNDSPENLELLTAGEHARLHHLGKKNPSKNSWGKGRVGKLTEIQRKAIKEDIRPQKLIAQDYGIHQTMVSKIKGGNKCH